MKPNPPTVRTSKFVGIKALLGLSLIAAVLVPASPVAGQAVHTCMGLSSTDAAARGFTVRIGTAGPDTINGSDSAPDFIVGLGGNDVLNGFGSGDVICGGAGDDTINAGVGYDRAFGGPGNDVLSMGPGNDRANGGWGDDQLIGGTGNDRLFGNRGADRISGENGGDLIVGNGGPDVIFGGYGKDTISGRLGADRLAGGPGDDTIYGGLGHDIVSGDQGNDTLFGGKGYDVIDGDANSDRIFAGFGTDLCDFSDGDRINACENELGEPVPDRPQLPPAGSPVPASQAPQGVNAFGWPLLTDTGLAALLHCESTTNHAINTGNGFYGGVQWLPTTWSRAAERAGQTQYINSLPHTVPADVQDLVTKVWWELTTPNTQWPHCHVEALAAMNVLAP